MLLVTRFVLAATICILHVLCRETARYSGKGGSDVAFSSNSYLEMYCYGNEFMNSQFFPFVVVFSGGHVHERISKLPVLHRTETDVTVSGQSAGAGMSVQLHVAFSNFVVGAALFAGAPYYCSRSQLKILVEQCTIYGTPNDEALEFMTRQWSSLGSIDNVENLSDDRVYLYHGKADTVLDLAVVQSLEAYYSSLIDNSTDGKGRIETFYSLGILYIFAHLFLYGITLTASNPLLCDRRGTLNTYHRLRSPM